MIDITGTRTRPGESEAGRYDFREPHGLSRLPLYLLGIVSAIAIYLRVAFPDLRWPVAPAEGKALPPDADDGAAPRVLQFGPVRPRAEDEPEPPEDIARPEAPEPVTGGNVVPFPTMRFKLIDSSPIDFSGVEVSSLGEAIPGGRAGTSVPTPAVPSQGPSSAVGGGHGAPPQGAERRNRAPESSGTLRLQEAVAGAVLLIGLDELLAAEVDADGDTVSIGKAWVSEGSIAVTDEGLVYSSNAATMPGDVTVFYEVTDGIATVIRSATIPVIRGPLQGKPEADILVGTPMGDIINGLAGNDIIDGRAGSDIVRGGDGDDRIQGGAGNDVILAGAGDDVVFAGEGDDIVSGGEGDDRLIGEAGDDILSGDEGADAISGGQGDDVIAGGEGNDHLDGGAGTDHVLGGDGDDTLMAAMDGVADIYAGGSGEDILDLSGATLALDINLAIGEVSSAEAGDDLISGFEIAIGGAGNDVFTIGGQAAQLAGGDGEDTFVFLLPDTVDAPTLIHDILDFVAGDRINVSRFEFTTEQDLEKEDRFNRYYGEDADGDPSRLELRIIHRNDAETGAMTTFQFDGDGDVEFEMVIEVHGHHEAYLYETATV